MKKLLTLALVGAMLTATGITAFAETTNVSYNVDPSYTVSIPAAVTLGDAAVTADITASDVILEDGKQIKVDLTAASNTASGSTFNAKNGDSAVTYTITGDKAIAVGDTVATFTANGSKTLTFSAADKTAATVAGAHTETLTFTISLEVATPTLNLTNPAVGEVIGSDGKNYAYASLPSGVTAVARICYVADTGSGLALALNDEASKMNWATACGENGATAHTPAFANGTWKLASRGEWSQMINAAGGYDALRDCFSSVGGTNMDSSEGYWASDNNLVGYSVGYCVYFTSSPAISNTSLSNSKNVRAVLAF